MFTASAILRLVQKGVLGLNDTIYEHIDDYLVRNNGSTLLEIWGGDKTVNDVTIF